MHLGFQILTCYDVAMMALNRIVVTAGLILALAATPAVSQPKRDAEGSKDSPLVSRFPGSIINDYAAKEFDEFNLPISKVTPQGMPKFLHLEGKVTRIAYWVPKDHSSLEVYRNYESAFKRLGFETLFACKGDDCGIVRYLPGAGWAEVWYGNGHFVFSGKLARPQGDIYLTLHVASEYACLDTIEIKPMQGGQITVNAAALKGDIGKSGHVAVYGIHFDTAKADIKQDSAPVLGEISKLLQEDPNLKLYVVGHTDNVGGLAANLELSRRRAAAVVQALTTQYGVAAGRLQAYGAGPYAPVASNDSEDGRALNRRVDLVKQ